jgi:uncharacterized RDD family membrane protein YckC
LLPYASTAPTPATLGLRLAAYILDTVLLALPANLINILLNLVLGAEQSGRLKLSVAILNQLTVYDPSELLFHNICGMVLALAYYTWLEGIWGASVGKRICGLRVTRLNHTPLEWRRALVRALIITGTPTILWLLGWNVAHTWGSSSSVQQLLTGIGLVIVPIRLAIFLTARQGNGYAGIHDLVSATRVVTRSACQPRPALPTALEAPPEIQGLSPIGPYHVLERIGNQDGTELLLGFDARLMRRVWIRVQRLDAPSVPASLRQLSRPGRLRWLTARRTDTEAWDAYEAASGQPLLKVIAQPQEWDRVRYWLLDLAEELLAASQDGTQPAPLSLERVWVTADGRAKLLDFAPPQSDNLQACQSPGNQPPASTPPGFLKLVAASALQGSNAGSSTTNPVTSPPMRLPLHASRFLQTLRTDADLSQCLAVLRTLLPLPARVSRAKRVLLLAGALAFPIIIAGLAWGVTAFKRNILIAAPELATLNECLTRHRLLLWEANRQKSIHREDIDAFETYIAGRFAPLVTNPAQWNNPITKVIIAPPLRDEAEQILKRKHPLEAAEFTAASARLETLLKKTPELAARETVENPNLFMGALAGGYWVTVIVVIIPCLVASLLFRGGAMVRLLGIFFVDRDGLPASRWRITARNLVAWLPFLLIPAALSINELLPIIVGLVVICLTATSLLLPKRGLQDRLAGTWPVPR